MINKYYLNRSGFKKILSYSTLTLGSKNPYKMSVIILSHTRPIRLRRIAPQRGALAQTNQH
jgi:hypothetical protein